MSVTSFTLRIHITASDYQQAAAERQTGNPDANPLAVALNLHTAYDLTGLADDQLTVVDRRDRARLIGEIPVDLAEFIALFELGAPPDDDRLVELALWREGA